MKIKYIILGLTVALTATIVTSCNPSESKTQKVIIVNASDIVRESIGVKGMTCVGCEVTLEENIAKIDGVVSVKASHTSEEAIIEFDATKTDIGTITKTIRDSGYKPFSK